MKGYIFYISLLFLTSYSFPQTVTGDEFISGNEYFSKSELRNLLAAGGKVKKIANDIFEVHYPGGPVRILNFRNPPAINYFPESIDSTFIGVYSLDTLAYADKFIFWKQVNITNSGTYPLIVDDINKNGNPEFYGYNSVRPGGFAGPARCLERNPNGTFNDLFSYDSTIFAKAIGDIHGDGRKSIYFHTDPFYTESGSFYTSSGLSTVPDSFDFILNYKEPNNIGFQINDMAFGDFNRNGRTDCAYDCWSDENSFIVGEYDSVMNNFSIKLLVDTIQGSNVSGSCIGDFDQDGKDEIIFNLDGTGYYVIEAGSDNNFEIVAHGEMPLPYPWLHTVTNDLDGDGRKEFWIGSVDYYYGSGTLLYAFEAGGDNSYKPVACIFLAGMSTIMGYYYLNSDDIDNDGIQEIIVMVGAELIILKFVGSPYHHSYKVFYYNKDKAGRYVWYSPCTFYDLDNDGLKDLLLPIAGEIKTLIFKQNPLSAILPDKNITIEEYNLLQNYPNPFNPVTTISYSIPKAGNVVLKVYDVLGRHVQTIVNEEKPVGTYEVNWNGAGFASGVYFYELRAGSFVETKRMILLR